MSLRALPLKNFGLIPSRSSRSISREESLRLLLAGIDFGTGGCKITVIDVDGNLVGEDSAEYATHFRHPGWAEQNPVDWYSAMCSVFAKLAEKGVPLKRIRAIALDGSTHNAVLLDGAMRPVRETIMWTDQRSTAECALLAEQYGEKIFKTAFQMPAPTWTLPQMMWLNRNEPDVLKKTEHMLFVKDYVRYQLTGVAVSDTIEAQGTLFYDFNNMKWSEELAALGGIRSSVLPTLVSPCDVVGAVTAQASHDTGLAEGIAVICGTSDSAVEDYGAGAIRPGQAIVKLATAGNFNVMTDKPHPDPRTLTYSHVIPGLWYTVSATNAAALCQRWLRDILLPASTGRDAYLQMDDEAGKSPVGSNGVMFHPYLQGERSPYWDSNLRGSFVGLGINSGRGDMCRALLEGVAMSLRDCRGVIEQMGLPVEELILIGGGARSKLWSRIVCNVMNTPLTCAVPGDASFGAALLAGVGIKCYATPADAVEHALTRGEPLMPDSEQAEFYDKLFVKYQAVHDALARVYAATSAKR